MQRMLATPRHDWCSQAEALGFHFHSLDGEPYWDESLYYRFSLRQVEEDIEAPSAELEAMCLALVAEAIDSEALLARMAIPEAFWPLVRDSWKRDEPALYGRMDLCYDGHGPARFYEYNADTPTSLYEAAFFQWVWLEQCREAGRLPAHADQYNRIQEALIARLAMLGERQAPLHLACCPEHIEDMGTVTYLADCAAQAGLEPVLTYIDDIGHRPGAGFIDLNDTPIRQLFKLYPWEWLFQEPFAAHIDSRTTRFIEPAWKSLLSNKAILPLLWERHPGHPNLIPACFADAPDSAPLGERWVRKPFFSREGANIAIETPTGVTTRVPGPYDQGPAILQAWTPPPDVGGRHPIIGSWLVGGEPVGMGVREDDSPITRDSSRFVPHIILD
ncbi:glutathionylspermidine synthase family protein [Halomonas sp. 328]|uniref:glutathionylspermidine synthase family protein n=1 Tax=Halomonas sp. 328 TaxID=2776704 RepID=UPI0018A74BC0|nr:glutathionylspermidine synthase family protein [Halomonas sp. 328]MBF8223944.1 glutathionylspermidine synthase family protein [Halomonas sp. 328]